MAVSWQAGSSHLSQSPPAELKAAPGPDRGPLADLAVRQDRLATMKARRCRHRHVPSSPSPSHPVLIVGGGISGLATAWYLRKAGIAATIVERRPRLGGVITTEVVEGCVIEGGPDSFLAAKPAALELIRELGLADEVIGSNDERRITYILRRQRLVPMPDGLMMMVPTKAWPMIKSPLVGWGSKLRMGLEYFRRPATHPDRSVADFIEDHFGREAVDYIAEPLLAGVYGGDPAALSANSTLTRFVDMERTTGSLTRAMLAAPKHSGESLFKTLKRGLGSLVTALNPTPDSVIQGEAEAWEPAAGRSDGHARVRVNGNWLTTKHLVLACPAYEAARLVSPAFAPVAALLGKVGYTSSVTMAFGFRRGEFNDPLNGFGFLVPRRERGALVACTWVGTKFEHRVPESHALLRCFLTSEADPDDVLAELRRIMGFRADPAFVRISSWPQSMAQYTIGHTERQKVLEDLTGAIPGLHLVGNAYQGIGLPDCIRLGKLAAERISSSSTPKNG